MDQQQQYQINLVARAKIGDADAFGELYNASYKMVYLTCLGHLKNPEDAEDTAQEVFITAYNKLDTLVDNATFFGWVKTIAIRTSLNKIAARKDNIYYDDAIESNENLEGDSSLENLPDAYIMEEEKRSIITKIMMAELSEVQYQTIFMFYYHDMTIDQIAQELNCPVGTVKVRLHKARLKIKSGIEEYERKSGDRLCAVGMFPALGMLFKTSLGSISVAAKPFMGMAAINTAGNIMGAGTNTVTAGGFNAAGVGAPTNGMVGMNGYSANPMVTVGGGNPTVGINGYSANPASSVGGGNPTIGMNGYGASVPNGVGGTPTAPAAHSVPTGHSMAVPNSTPSAQSVPTGHSMAFSHSSPATTGYSAAVPTTPSASTGYSASAHASSVAPTGNYAAGPGMNANQPGGTYAYSGQYQTSNPNVQQGNGDNIKSSKHGKGVKSVASSAAKTTAAVSLKIQIIAAIVALIVIVGTVVTVAVVNEKSNDKTTRRHTSHYYDDDEDDEDEDEMTEADIAIDTTVDIVDETTATAAETTAAAAAEDDLTPDELPDIDIDSIVSLQECTLQAIVFSGGDVYETTGYAPQFTLADANTQDLINERLRNMQSAIVDSYFDYFPHVYNYYLYQRTGTIVTLKLLCTSSIYDMDGEEYVQIVEYYTFDVVTGELITSDELIDEYNIYETAVSTLQPILVGGTSFEEIWVDHENQPVYEKSIMAVAVGDGVKVYDSDNLGECAYETDTCCLITGDCEALFIVKDKSDDSMVLYSRKYYGIYSHWPMGETTWVDTNNDGVADENDEYIYGPQDDGVTVDLYTLAYIVNNMINKIH